MSYCPLPYDPYGHLMQQEALWQWQQPRPAPNDWINWNPMCPQEISGSPPGWRVQGFQHFPLNGVYKADWIRHFYSWREDHRHFWQFPTYWNTEETAFAYWQETKRRYVWCLRWANGQDMLQCVQGRREHKENVPGWGFYSPTSGQWFEFNPNNELFEQAGIQFELCGSVLQVQQARDAEALHKKKHDMNRSGNTQTRIGVYGTNGPEPEQRPITIPCAQTPVPLPRVSNTPGTPLPVTVTRTPGTPVHGLIASVRRTSGSQAPSTPTTRSMPLATCLGVAAPHSPSQLGTPRAAAAHTPAPSTPTGYMGSVAAPTPDQPTQQEIILVKGDKSESRGSRSRKRKRSGRSRSRKRRRSSEGKHRQKTTRKK